MNFTCNECNDSGSRDKLGTYLDCNACGTAATRRDLNDFVKSLGPTHPEDVALSIHQRALAMAPKQEAQEPVAEVSAMPGTSGFTMAVFKADDMPIGSKVYAAPSAANGALTDEQVHQGVMALLGCTSSEVEDYSAKLYEGYANDVRRVHASLAAAGQDAALVKALESALAIINNEADPYEYAAPLKAIRAALSGAKGN